MIVCPNCGSDSEDDSRFCEECGFQLSDKTFKVNTSPPQEKPSERKKIRFIRQKK